MSDVIHDLMKLENMLYSAKARHIDPLVDDVKRLLGSAYETVRDKRVLKWELVSTAIYGIPAAIRFITKNPVIPLLNALDYSPSPYIPANIVEKVLVNSFFPGGAGGIIGETFLSRYNGRELEGRAKYLARLGGAMLQYAGWTAFQYALYLQNIIGPHGQNISEPPEIMPFNLLLAALSVFTPDVVDYVSSKIQEYRRIR